MAKSYFSDVEEYTGPVPSGGYKCVIVDIEATKTKESGHKMYVASLRVLEPKKYKGTHLRTWFVVGTEDDPRAREHETWKTSNGSRRLYKMLKRAGVAAKDGDEEEWMDAAQGQEICVHVLREMRDGTVRNNVTDFFREKDEEFVGIGEELEAPPARGSSQDRAARGGNSDKPPRGGRAARPPVDNEDEDGPPTRKAKAPTTDEDEDEQPARVAKAVAEEEEEPTARKAKAKGAKGKLPEGDDDEDED